MAAAAGTAAGLSAAGAAEGTAAAGTAAAAEGAAAAGTAAAAGAGAGSTLATVSSIAGLAGAGISAIGAMTQGKANSANAAYQAQVASNNAIIAKQNSETTAAAGEQRAQAIGLKAAGALADTKASESALGVDVNTGSNLETQKSQRELSLNDVQNARYSSYLAARGQQLEGTNQQAQADLLTAESKQYGIAGDLAAGGSLASGASSVGSKYAAWLNTTGNSNPAPAAATG